MAKTLNNDQHTFFMCVHKKVLLNLCTFFPSSHRNLKARSVERRLAFIKAMEKLDRRSIHKALPEHSEAQSNPMMKQLSKFTGAKLKHHIDTSDI